MSVAGKIFLRSRPDIKIDASILQPSSNRRMPIIDQLYVHLRVVVVKRLQSFRQKRHVRDQR